ncbi:MAG: homoserine dehydrogenase [Candidatus Thermoplasmatota archaeon]|nr:homoserine dehydrogenase [Candidatus Thermoplasmatota archaeon]
MKVALIGLGNVGRNLLRILDEDGNRISQACGSTIEIISATDSSGTALFRQPVKPKELLDAKVKGSFPSEFNEGSLDDALEMKPDAIVDMSPATKDGNRELGIYLKAIKHGSHIITANKSPLALHWKEIMDEAELNGISILHEATVAGGVPIFNFVRYSCGPSSIITFHGIVSLTANYVLMLMTKGMDFQDAVKKAQEMGIAEADYTDDTSGLDAARKSVILANALFNRNYTLKDIKYSGIEQLSADDITKHGRKMRLVTDLKMVNGEFQLFSGFRTLQDEDFGLTLGETSLGYELVTNNSGTLRLYSTHDGPRETASAVVNDIMILARSIQR